MRHISVIGPGRCAGQQYHEAQEVGRLIASRGAILVCGGLGGVMEAAARGAREGGGSTVGILPGHDRAVANPYIDEAVTTGLGEARNLIVVSTGDAVIAVGGGYGTLSEIGLAVKIGRPVVILHGWQLERPEEAVMDDTQIRYASSPEEAVATAFDLLGPTPAAGGGMLMDERSSQARP
jgi:uncharacterized protein (TIGR00725 family)